MIRLEQIELPEDLQQARDFFMFSFYAQGMRFIDVALLKAENIKSDRVVYTARKTKKLTEIPLHADLKRIVDKYKKKGFLFDLGFKFSDSLMDNETQIFNANIQINKKLKKIAALAGIDKKLTCHVSRHTFANQMFQEFGMEGIGLISRTLGHTTEATTRAYVLPLANDGISKKVSEFYSKIKR